MGTSTTALPQVGTRAIIVRSLIIDIAVITTVWGLGIFISNPVGEFPLNDDWSYSRAVMHLLETGDYRPLGWAVMTLFTHVLWGALFCLPVGFSFTALRISGVVAGLLGLLGTYILVRDLQQPRWVALIITFALAFYPPYYVVSNSFMTDISFAALSIWSVIFLARSMRNRSDLHLLIGTALAVAAILSRQLGLAIPIAFAITMLLRPELNMRTVWRAIAPLAVCVIAFLAYNYWLEVTARAPVQYTAISAMPLQHTTTIANFLVAFSVVAFYAPIYVGLFLLPVFISSWRQLFWSTEMRTLWLSHGVGAACLIAAGILTMVASAISVSRFRDYSIFLPMPDRGNMLEKPGLGTFSLRDSIILNLDHHLVALPNAFWVVITVLGMIGAVLLIAKVSVHVIDFMKRVFHTRQSIGGNEAVSIFLVICSIVYVLPFTSWGFFDRYLILLVPLLGAGIVGISGKPSEVPLRDARVPCTVASVLLVAWGAVSICGTRDYLTWNRVRWQALHDLMRDGQVGPQDIDGGFEFNGLYLYDPNYQPDDPNEPNSRSSWWVHRATYQIGFGIVPGYTVIKEYTYQHWLPPHSQKVVVMRKEP